MKLAKILLTHSHTHTHIHTHIGTAVCDQESVYNRKYTMLFSTSVE